MKTIEVSLENFKILTMLLENEDMTYNDVISNLLSQKESISSMQNREDGWSRKGAFIPNGADLRFLYKGKAHFGKIKKGLIEVDGEFFPAPSPAAMKINGGIGINGWFAWECKFPGEHKWVPLYKLRKNAN